MKPVFNLFRLNDKKGCKGALGALESEIMEIVWHKEEACVRDVCTVISEKREIAYTTVMTVMDRLSKKKLLRRDMRGKTHYYQPALSREEFNRHLMKDIFSGIEREALPDVMNFFVSEMAKGDPERLDELENLIEQKKRELNAKKQ